MIEGMPVALPATLALAVPMHIDRLRGHTAEQLITIAKRCATTVGSEGDNLLFTASKKGATGRVFNALAEGLAVLAFAPGGVEFAGMRWQVEVGASPLHPADMADQLAELARMSTPITTGGRL